MTSRMQRSDEGRTLHAVRAISRTMLRLGGVIMLAAAGLIVLEVFMRQAFNVSLGGVDELAGYALAISSSWSFAAALLDKAHVRIDSLYLCFPRPLRGLLDIVSLGLLLAFLALLIRYASDVLVLSISFRSTSQTPLATPLMIPQALWFFGLVWFAVAAAILLAAAARALAAGDVARISRLAGPPSPDEEIGSEIEDIRRRSEARPAR